MRQLFIQLQVATASSASGLSRILLMDLEKCFLSTYNKMEYESSVKLKDNGEL